MTKRKVAKAKARAKRNTKAHNTRRNNVVKKFGDIFTPTELVQDVLSHLPDSSWDEKKTSIDPCCGNGQFLEEVLQKKIDAGRSVDEALSTTFGVEIQPKWVLVCRHRLFDFAVRNAPKGTKKKTFVKWLHVVAENIICADALKLMTGGFTGADWFDANSMKGPSPFGILTQEKGKRWELVLGWKELQELVEEDESELASWVEENYGSC